MIESDVQYKLHKLLFERKTTFIFPANLFTGAFYGSKNIFITQKSDCFQVFLLMDRSRWRECPYFPSFKAIFVNKR